MGESVCQSINAALRACMPCEAAPAVRRWVLFDRVSESRAQPGMQIMAKLDSVPARDSLGRIAHVRGLFVKAFGRFDLADAGPSPAVSAYQLRSLFQALFLQDVTGHAYWPSIDARDILDDNFFRHFARIQTPYLHTGVQAGPTPYGPGITADNGLPAAVSPILGLGRDLSFYAPLVTLGPGMNPLAGLIPLAALQRQSRQGAFRFRLQTAIAGAPANVSFLGVENGEGNPGLDLWMDVVYLPALAIGPSYTLESYTLDDTSGILRRPEDTTEHVHVRYYPDDVPGGAVPGQGAVQNMDIITLTTAGFVEHDGLSQADWRDKMLLTYGSERDSAAARANAAQDLPLLGTLDGLPLVGMFLPYRQRGMGPAAGSINYKIGNSGGNTFFRFNHRTVSCNEKDTAQAIAGAVGCDPCSKTVMTDGQGKPVAAESAYSTGVALVLDPAANGGKKG